MSVINTTISQYMNKSTMRISVLSKYKRRTTVLQVSFLCITFYALSYFAVRTIDPPLNFRQSLGLVGMTLSAIIATVGISLLRNLMKAGESHCMESPEPTTQSPCICHKMTRQGIVYETIREQVIREVAPQVAASSLRAALNAVEEVKDGMLKGDWAERRMRETREARDRLAAEQTDTQTLDNLEAEESENALSDESWVM